MPRPYPDRVAAGQALARALGAFASRTDVLILALPRGGVPVARQVADALGAPLDVMIVRKLGVPGHEELAMGALASGGTIVRNESVLSQLDIDPEILEKVIAAERAELQRREQFYRGDRPPLHLAGKTVILVDDGLATGSTMRAAALAAHQQNAAAVIVAAAVAPTDTIEDLQVTPEIDQVICPWTPEPFGGVGRFFSDFHQVTDEQVREMLASGKEPRA